MRIYADKLSVLLNIRDNVVDGNLSGCTCRCRNGDDRNALVLCSDSSLKTSYIFVLGVVDDDTDSLSCIHRGAAADSDDIVGT